MTDHTIDAATKRRVLDALVLHLRTRLDALTGDDRAETEAARLDQDVTLEPDDTSHSDEAADLQGLVADRATPLREEIARAEALDDAVSDRVRVGSVVGFGGQRYVVGVAVDEFACDGASYTGIAPDAPVFAVLEGRRVGDSVTVGGREHRIDLVG